MMNLVPPTWVQDMTVGQLLQCIDVPKDLHSFWGTLSNDDKWSYLQEFLTLWLDVLPVENGHSPSGFAFLALAAAVETQAKAASWKDYNDYVERSLLPGMQLTPSDYTRVDPGDIVSYANVNDAVGLAWPPPPHQSNPIYSTFGWRASANACARLMTALRAAPAMAPLFAGDGTPANPGMGFFTNGRDPYPSVGCSHDWEPLNAVPTGFVAVMYHFPDGTDVVVLTNTTYCAVAAGSPESVNELIRIAYDGP